MSPVVGLNKADNSGSFSSPTDSSAVSKILPASTKMRDTVYVVCKVGCLCVSLSLFACRERDIVVVVAAAVVPRNQSVFM